MNDSSSGSTTTCITLPRRNSETEVRMVLMHHGTLLIQQQSHTFNAGILHNPPMDFTRQGKITPSL